MLVQPIGVKMVGVVHAARVVVTGVDVREVGVASSAIRVSVKL